jgi:hypothetical protein
MSDSTTSEAVASGAGEAIASSPAPEVTNTAPVAETKPVETVETKAAEKPAEKPKTLKEAMDDTARKAYRKAQGIKPRDETGKFASDSPLPRAPVFKADSAKAEASPAAETAQAEATPPVEAKVEPAAKPLDAPAHFKAEDKAKFANLPREAQEVVLATEKTREADYTKRSQEFAEFKKQTDAFRQQAEHYHRSTAPLLQAIEPFRQYLAQTSQSTRIPVPEMLSGLLRTESQLRMGSPDQKLAVLRNIAAEYGVSFDGQGQYSPDANPEVSQIRQEIAALRQENQRLTGAMTNQQRIEHQRMQQWQHAQQQAQMQEQAQLQSHIAESAKDKPHFEELRKPMAALLQSGAAQDLNQAYEMASYADPNIRAQILADQRAKDEAKRQKEAREHADKARLAAAVNVTSVPSKSNPKQWSDTVRAAARAAYSA